MTTKKEPEKKYCPRCAAMRPVDAPDFSWKVAKIVWMVIAGMLLCATPLIAADVLFLTPLVMMFLMGGASLMERANAEPRCAYCQYPIGRDRGDTGNRGDKASSSNANVNAVSPRATGGRVVKETSESHN